MEFGINMGHNFLVAFIQPQLLTTKNHPHFLAEDSVHFQSQ